MQVSSSFSQHLLQLLCHCSRQIETPPPLSPHLENKVQHITVFSTLQGVSSAGLSVVLQGLYTTQVNLTCDNVVDVLTTAHFLQIRHIIAFCEKFLEETMSREHCLQYLKLAEVYNLDPSIINLAEQCFVQNFLAVSQVQYDSA